MSLSSCLRGQTPAGSSAPKESSSLPANDPHVAVMGRTLTGSDGSLRFGYPGVTLRVAFTGTSLALEGGSTSGNSRLAVSADLGAPSVVRLPQGSARVMLVEGLDEGPHQVDLVHRTETWQGIVSVRGFVLPEGRSLLAPKPWPERRLMLIGDSVTSGEGAGRSASCENDKPAGASAYDSYGMRLARALGAQVHLISYGGRGLVRDWQGKTDVLNAPQFFQLTIAEDSPKVLWNHATYRPDLVLVSLGTNDFNLALGAPPERGDYVGTYVAFVKTIRGVYPEARVILTEGAMLNDADSSRPQKSTLRSYLQDTVSQLADEHVRFVPSSHYPGDACDAHPTGEQHAAMAADLEPVVREMTGW